MVIFHILFVGLLSCLVMDLWQRLVKLTYGINPSDWGVIGRWLIMLILKQKVLNPNIENEKPYKNELIIGQGFHHPTLYSDSCYVDEVNLINMKKFEGKFDCTAKFRYRQADVPVSIEFIGEDILVTFKEDVRAVTPGQAAVFYSGDECLGGGFIKEAYKNNEKRKY